VTRRATGFNPAAFVVEWCGTPDQSEVAPMNSSRTEIRDANGQLVGYFVPAEELNRLDTEVEALRRQRETAERQLRSLLPAATAEQEELFRRQLDEGRWADGEQVIADIISDLRGDG
jgi:hypothetical protein